MGRGDKDELSLELKALVERMDRTNAQTSGEMVHSMLDTLLGGEVRCLS